MERERGEGEEDLVVVVVASGGAEEKRVFGRVGAHEREAVHAPAHEARDDQCDEEVEPEGPHVGQLAIATLVGFLAGGG